MYRKLIIPLLLVLSASCVYYNLFYNAKQNFKQAEENQRRSQVNRLGQDTSTPAGYSIFQEPSVSMTERNLFKAAIEKANKVVVFHPESKYADDALWIIGKSRYNMTEYVTADKRLRELVIKYPNSKYADDAYFYMGMSQFWLKSYDLALEALNKVMEMKKSSYKDDAAFVISLMYFIQGNYNSAIASFADFLSNFPKSDSAALAQYCVGACYDSLGEFDMALRAYNNVDKYKSSFELYFIARYAAGSAAFRADSVELGMAVFKELAKQERYFDRSSTIRLKIAEGMNLSGKSDEAISEYLKVIEQFPKTMESAEAYYRLGLIYQNDMYDLEKAKEYFNIAAQEKKDSPFRNLALAHSAQISKLETYKSRLGRISGKEIEPVDSAITYSNEKSDSLSVVDTATTQQPLDSVSSPDTMIVGDIPADSFTSRLPESLVVGGLEPSDSIDITIELMAGSSSQALADMVAISDGLLSMPDSLLKSDSVSAVEAVADTGEQTVKEDTSSIDEDIEIRFLLAELYYHDLNHPDSALSEYLLLAESYPESPYAPKALLASAQICEHKEDTIKAKELYKRIVNFYPSTEQARYAVKKCDGIIIPPEKDVAGLYTRAEDLYFVYGKPDSALMLFEFIEATFPQSEFAAKSAFARAWIMDKTLKTDGDSSSYYAFAEVAENYPETPYAEEAKMKMGLVKRKLPIQRQQPEEPPVEEPLTPEDDSLGRARADSLSRFAFTLPPAPAVKDTGEFLYPEHLLKLKLKGRVRFMIKIDLFGNVVDYEMLGPSGNADIDSVVTEALLNTTFDVSSIQDLSKLDGYFRYDIPFEPPELDGFYDPYRELEERGP